LGNWKFSSMPRLLGAVSALKNDNINTCYPLRCLYSHVDQIGLAVLFNYFLSERRARAIYSMTQKSLCLCKNKCWKWEVIQKSLCTCKNKCWKWEVIQKSLYTLRTSVGSGKSFKSPCTLVRTNVGSGK
jgi:hypothetical protein